LKKLIYVCVSILFMLGGCGKMDRQQQNINSNGEERQVNDMYRDEHISVEATLNEKENGTYLLSGTIHNHSNEPIELLYDCGEWIRYKGKPKADVCIEVYSKTIEPKNDEAFEMFIDKNIIEKTTPFSIQIIYKTNNDFQPHQVDIQIPIS